MARKYFVGVAGAAIAALVLAGCSSGAGSKDAPATEGKPAGNITVLTNRTDLVNTTFKGYKKTFEAKYPGVTVKFEAITDYESEVKTRMNTKDYGDVLLIPASVATTDFPDFFEPLGKVKELSTKYRFAGEAATDGTVYGLATFGNANGIVYNKKVFAAAGITELPKTTTEFIADLKAIKDKTDAVPLYSNYKDGWPLNWPENLMGAYSGDPEAFVKLSKTKAPWTKGEEKYTSDSLLFDVAAAGLIEKDPTTTNWENSKDLIATGKIGVMVLGSWAIPQMQEAATKAGGNPADIGFMPAPTQVGGKFYSPVGGDFKLAININSTHKAAARAWIDWFVEDSGFYKVAGAVPTVKAQAAPASLKEFEATGVQYIEMTPAPTLSVIDNAAEIGLSQADYYRTLIDAARGASGKTKDQIFAGLNSKWATGLAQVG